MFMTFINFWTRTTQFTALWKHSKFWAGLRQAWRFIRCYWAFNRSSVDWKHSLDSWHWLPLVSSSLCLAKRNLSEALRTHPYSFMALLKRGTLWYHNNIPKSAETRAQGFTLSSDFMTRNSIGVGIRDQLVSSGMLLGNIRNSMAYFTGEYR